MTMNRTIAPMTARIATPAVCRKLGDGDDAVDEVGDVLHAFDGRIGSQRLHDRPEVGRVAQLHLEAGVERVRVEVPGEVLLALRRARLAEAAERLLLRDVGDPADLGQRGDPGLERRHVDVGRGLAEVGHDLHLLLDEGEPGQEPVLDDEEPGEQEEHQGHRRHGREAHRRIAPEPLPGPRQAEADEPDHPAAAAACRRHPLSHGGGTRRRSRRG